MLTCHVRKKLLKAHNFFTTFGNSSQGQITVTNPSPAPIYFKFHSKCLKPEKISNRITINYVNSRILWQNSYQVSHISSFILPIPEKLQNLKTSASIWKNNSKFLHKYAKIAEIFCLCTEKTQFCFTHHIWEKNGRILWIFQTNKKKINIQHYWQGIIYFTK